MLEEERHGGRRQKWIDVVAIATPKHYLANNSEANRNFGTSNVTERSLLEYFTVPFSMSAGQAGARSLMLSAHAIPMHRRSPAAFQKR